MPNQEHERERERDQTHSYWYIPLAPRENYSLLVMESTGMMKMATRERFPLLQGARTGLDWFSVATEASGGGTPDLLCSPMFLGYIWVYMGGRSTSVDLRAVHEAGGTPRGVGAPPTLTGNPGLSWSISDTQWTSSVPKITLPKVSFRLDSI